MFDFLSIKNWECISWLVMNVRCIDLVMVKIPLRRGELGTTLCAKVCQWLAAGQFSPGILVSSTNKTDHDNITVILLKVA